MCNTPGPTALFGLVFLLGLTDGPIYHLTQKIVSPLPQHPSVNPHRQTPPLLQIEKISSISEVPPQDLRCLIILDPTSFHQSHARVEGETFL